MGTGAVVRNSSIVAASFMLATAALAQTTVEHPEVLRARVGLRAAPSASSLAPLKVAILDVGFSGYSADAGLLPASTQLIEGPVNPQLGTNHGLVMAQIIWGMLGRAASGPQFYLINTNGLSNFRAAIDFVIANSVDVVVYAQNWTFGGNLDGTGFVNALVTRALDAGVTWINASGNDHDLVFASAITTLSDGAVVLPGADNTLNITVDLDDTELSVYLLWTDVNDDDQVSATTDLDLVLQSSAGVELAAGRRRQGGPVGEETTSRFARETVTATVNRGSYRVRVSDFSRNLRSTDELRVLVSSNKPGTIHLTEASHRREILPPADHAGVITVGEGSGRSSVGPTRDGRVKPDMTIGDSSVSFTDGMGSAGSSNATAMFAARVLAELATHVTERGEARRTLVRGLARGYSAPQDFACLREMPFWFLASDFSSGLPRGTRAGNDPSGRHYAVLPPGRSRSAVRASTLANPFFMVITATEEAALCAAP